MSSPLLERDDERARLLALIDALPRSTGGAVVIDGAAGVGKSTLLNATSELAVERDFTVLRAIGMSTGGEPPWLAVRELFEPCLRTMADRDALLTGAAGMSAAVLGRDPEPQRANGVPAMVMHGLYWLVANLAQRGPLVIGIDDAHLVDAPSQRWLAYLALRLSDLPVLLVATATASEDDANPELLALRAASEVMPLANLSYDAAAALVHDLLAGPVDPDFADECVLMSRGNPFLLIELLREVQSAGVAPTAAHAARVAGMLPANVHRMVRLRLARVGQEAADVAHAATILGADASIRNIGQLVELDTADVEAAAHRLQLADLLDQGTPLRFAHPLVHSAVYESLAPADRTLWHRRAAELLAHRGATSDQIAAQLLACEPAGDQIVVRALRGAATDALHAGAPESAICFLRRAIAEGTDAGADPDLLRELGSAQASMGDPEADTHLRRALELESSPRERAETARVLGSLLTRRGCSADAVTLLDNAIADLDGHDDELRLRLETDAIASAREDFAVRGHIPERIGRLAGLEGSSAAELVLLANMAMESAAAGASARETVELAERALAEGRLLDEETADSPACYLAIHALVAADRPDRAAQHLEKAFADVRRRGSLWGLACASICASHAYLTGGDVALAISHARTALAIGSAAGWVGMNPWAVAFLVNALVQRGELDEARALIERNGLAGELPEAPFFEPIASARARLAIAAGDPAEALAVARFGELMVKSGTVNPGLSSWRSEAALALAGVGRAAEAHELAQEELRLARTYGAPRPIGAALRTVAKLSAGEQRLDALREAVGVLERSPAQLERAAAHVELGTALRLAGRNQDARYPLRRGRELAMGCGAVALVVQARAELVASGGRPRKDPADGRAALTPSELRVAELASRGNTNREIAESLFVTLRTVELQLTHAYQKLGIASRGELADALREPRGA